MKRFSYKLILLSTVLMLVISACTLPGVSAPTPLPTLDIYATATAIAKQLEASVATPTLLPPTASGIASPPPSQAPSAFPTVNNPVLTHIRMVDATNGWALTSQYILRTRDGGGGWENVTPQGGFGGGTNLSGYFLDVNHGWVVVPSADFTSGTLYRTSDQGQTWQSTPAPFGGGDLQFLDPQNGWVMVGTGAAAGSSTVDIYQTSDAGMSWTKVYSLDPANSQTSGNLPFSGSKNGMAFRDASHGWVGGTEPLDGYVWLFATQDGGKTWTHQDVSLPSGYEKGQTSIDAPVFFNKQDGVLPVSLFKGDTLGKDFYVTTDGGATWHSTQVVLNSGTYWVSSMLDFWVWDGVKLSSSHDGGQSWNTFNPPLNLKDVIAGIDFVDKNNGWVITMDASGQGQLYMTPNGGLTWIVPSTAQLAPTAQAVAQSTATITPTPTTKPTAAAVVPSKRSGVSVAAVFLSKKPTIDGVLDDWDLTRYTVDNVVFGDSNWSGMDDSSGRVMFGWDNKFLYIAVRVADDVYAQNASGKNLFKGDSIEIQLDTDVQGDFFVHSLNSDDFQIGISGGNESSSPEAYLWYPDAMAGSLDNVKIGATFASDNYKIEAAIPWSVLDVTPGKGEHFGFAFSISDNDNPSKNVQQTLVSLVPSRKLTDPTTWGDLTLK